jgi:dihydropteroate synthase
MDVTPASRQALINGTLFAWGSRTYVMGIVNVTPDSFSGDGLIQSGIAAHDPVGAALALVDRMVREGVDIVDVGGESTRPGHTPIDAADEAGRVVPVIAAIRAAHPTLPISIDSSKPSVAAVAIDAGAGLINDVWGVRDDDEMDRLAAGHGVPIALMHNRVGPQGGDIVADVVSELERAVERARRAGVPAGSILIDPGIGFGKTAAQNLTLLRELGALSALGHPVLLGTSRKSTLGRVLDLPPEERLEATLVTTALGVAAGADIVRVHDVRPNVRAARMADAIVRAIPEHLNA